MLAKEITYTDYLGVERKETFYFNLTESELTELSFSEEGGIQGILEKIIESKSVPKIMMYFKKIILISYGERTNDGKNFMKSEELSKMFECSPAYDVLFMELFNDGVKANEFFKGIIPAKFRAEIEANEKEKNDRIELAKANANISALPGNVNN